MRDHLHHNLISHRTGGHQTTVLPTHAGRETLGRPGKRPGGVPISPGSMPPATMIAPLDRGQIQGGTYRQGTKPRYSEIDVRGAEWFIRNFAQKAGCPRPQKELPDDRRQAPAWAWCRTECRLTANCRAHQRPWLFRPFNMFR